MLVAMFYFVLFPTEGATVDGGGVGGLMAANVLFVALCTEQSITLTTCRPKATGFKQFFVVV